MDEILKRYAESEDFDGMYELLKTVEVQGDESYRIEIYKSYSRPGPLLFFARCYVKRPIPVKPEDFPRDVWASDSYKVDEQDYPDAEAALSGALRHLGTRIRSRLK
jgi:hypothetical protein